MSDKRVYTSGRKNPNAYEKIRPKRFITALIIFTVIVFVLTIEILDKKNGDAWNNTYVNAGITGAIPEIVDSELNIYYLDVGQSNCSIICNKGQVIMIDAGAPDKTDEITKVLQQLKINKIDFLYLTHQHDDHIGGALTVLQNYEVTNIIMPKLSDINMVTTSYYEKLLTTIKEKKINAIPATPGYSFSVGDARCLVLAPLSQDENLNNMSAVLKVNFGNKSFLFQGDAEKKAEKAILASKANVEADVLLVGHHGSKTSSSSDYIKAVSPSVSIISCSSDNSYGHPHKQTLDTLEKAKSDIFITCNDGMITLRCDGKKISLIKNSEVVKIYE